MKIFLLLAMLSVNAQAMDHRSQIGAGGALGATFPAPWGSETFRNSVTANAPAASAWVRYIPGTPEIGWELSYNYFGLGTMNLHTHAAVVSFISRQNPWGNFHPFYAVGVGYAHSLNKFGVGDAGVWDDPVFKLTAGIDFELNPRTDVGLQLNHYSIFKDAANQQNIHVIVPVLTMTYYFGTPAPLPTAPAPKPVPAPVAAPVAFTPAPKANPAPAPKAKKPARKRIRREPIPEKDTQ